MQNLRMTPSLALILGILAVVGCSSRGCSSHEAQDEADAENGDDGAPPPTPALSCSGMGQWALFVAKFDTDSPGSPPSTTGSFGPAGAALRLKGRDGWIEVIQSTPMSSQAVRLVRVKPEGDPLPDPGSVETTSMKCTRGDLESSGAPYDVRYNVYAEVSSDESLTNLRTTIISDGQPAASLLFYDNKYEVGSGAGTESLPQVYPDNQKHEVHIKLDPGAKIFSVCIDGTTVAADKPFMDQFAATHMDSVRAVVFSLATFVPTEETKVSYVVDEVRIHGSK